MMKINLIRMMSTMTKKVTPTMKMRKKKVRTQNPTKMIIIIMRMMNITMKRTMRNQRRLLVMKNLKRRKTKAARIQKNKMRSSNSRQTLLMKLVSQKKRIRKIRRRKHLSKVIKCRNLRRPLRKLR